MMRRESRRVIGGWRATVTPEVGHVRQRDDEGELRRQPPLQASWRPDADEGPHQESQIEAADVHEQTLQDVRVAPEMCPSHAAGLVEMRVRPFQAFTPSPQQGESTRAVNAPTIRIHRGFGCDGPHEGGLPGGGHNLNQRNAYGVSSIQVSVPLVRADSGPARPLLQWPCHEKMLTTGVAMGPRLRISAS